MQIVLTDSLLNSHLHVATHCKFTSSHVHYIIMYCNSQPGINNLVSLYSKTFSGISTDESCGRVEFSVSSLLVNLINTPVLPVCCRL